MSKLETPEEYFGEANRAINMEEWNRATAYATTGLLSLLIGAFKGMLKIGGGPS